MQLQKLGDMFMEFYLELYWILRCQRRDRALRRLLNLARELERMCWLIIMADE